MTMHLENSEEMLTFAPDDESQKRLVVRHRVFFDANYSRIRRLERSLIRTRLCRLPEQEPSKFSISRTAFIQRNPANLSKVTKRRMKSQINLCLSLFFSIFARNLTIHLLNLRKI